MADTRSEYAANISLVATTKKPHWMQPAPIRTKRKTYRVLSIAQRHPGLFAALTSLLLK